MYRKIGTQSWEHVKIAQYSVFSVSLWQMQVSVQMTSLLTVTMICKNYTSHKENALDTLIHWHMTLFLNTHTGQQFGYQTFLLHKRYYWKHSKAANTSRRLVLRDMFEIMAIEIYNSYSCFSVVTHLILT